MVYSNHTDGSHLDPGSATERGVSSFYNASSMGGSTSGLTSVATATSGVLSGDRSIADPQTVGASTGNRIELKPFHIDCERIVIDGTLLFDENYYYPPPGQIQGHTYLPQIPLKYQTGDERQKQLAERIQNRVINNRLMHPCECGHPTYIAVGKGPGICKEFQVHLDEVEVYKEIIAMQDYRTRTPGTSIHLKQVVDFVHDRAFQVQLPNDNILKWNAFDTLSNMELQLPGNKPKAIDLKARREWKRRTEQINKAKKMIEEIQG